MPTIPLRLVCLPYAGAGASAYGAWRRVAPPELELSPVQYPGREERGAEPLAHDVRGLLASILPSLHDVLEGPFALFGHSLGALVAFELARELRRAGRPGPTHLWLSGRQAPQFPSRMPRTVGRSEAEVVSAVTRLGGTPRALFEDQGMRDYFLPILRADLAMLERYVYVEEPPLDCPISVLGGANDPITNGDELEGWRCHTRGAFAVHVLPGDHFYLNGQWPAISQHITRKLAVS